MPTRKVIVITGASDGIGAAAARALSARGHRIVLVGRSREKTQRIAQELEQEFHVADFAELAQVRALAHLLLERHPRIDVLANNAGGVFGRNRQLTIDGHEVTFQVNYLAPFLLTSLLMERLIESRASVINTSSVANRAYGRIDLANLNGQKRYNPVTAYGNAKLAQILFTKELHHRYADRGLASAAFHPGNIATSFSTQAGAGLRLVYQTWIGRHILQTPEKGADTLVWLADAEAGTDYPSGEYFVRRRIRRANRQAYEETLARDLWAASERLLHSR